MADHKIAIRLVADGDAFIGEVRLAADALESVTEAANDAGDALQDAGRAGNVADLAAFRAAIRGATSDLAGLSERTRALQQASAGAGQGLTEHRERLAATGREAVNTNQSTGALTGGLNLLRGGMAALAGIGVAATLKEIGTEAISARRETEQLTVRLSGLTTGAVELAETQEYLAKTARTLSADQVTLTESYTQLLNLRKADLLTTEQARKLLEGFSNIQAATGASTEQLGQTMYGLSQALASGVVRAEEFNQVTEPLPGLMQALDKAAGQMSGGFRRLVNDGKVTSSMFRDTLVKALDEYAGAAERTSNTIVAAETRWKNSRQALLDMLGRKLQPAYQAGVTAAADTADALVKGDKKGQDFQNVQLYTQEFEKLVKAYKDLKAARDDLDKISSSSAPSLRAKELSELLGRSEQLKEQIATLEARVKELAAATGRTQAVDTSRRHDEGTAATTAKLTADQATAFDEAAKKAGYLRQQGQLLREEEAELATATTALTAILKLPPAELVKFGISARGVGVVLDGLKQKLDPLAAAVAALDRELDLLKAPAGLDRDLLAAWQNAQAGRTREIDFGEKIQLDTAVQASRTAALATENRQLALKETLEHRVGVAQGQGAAAQAEAARVTALAGKAQEVYGIAAAEAVAKAGGMTPALRAQYPVLAQHADALRKVDYARIGGEASATATGLSVQARQARELAAATREGGAAAWEAATRHKVENETRQAGAGLSSELAARVRDEAEAQRELAQAQWDREIDTQITQALALAAAEVQGADAVAEATIATQAAAQAEKEGVAADGARAKAIGEKIRALAEWQQRQGAAAAGRQADDDLTLLREEVRLQGAGAAERERTLALLREEQAIRRDFPLLSAAEREELLKKKALLYDTGASLKEQQALYEEIGNGLGQAFDRIGSAITEGFAQGSLAAINFRDLARATLSELVQLALRLAVINPMKNWVTGGSAPSLWSALSSGGSGGASGAAGGAGGGASGGGVSVGVGDLFRLGSLTSQSGLGGFDTSFLSGGWLDRQLGGSLTGVNTWLNSPIGGYEALPAGQFGPPAPASGVSWGNALGAVGYGFNAFQNFKSGNVVGGIGNTAASVMMFIPGAQPFAPFVAIGSQILGGLFGNKQPSNREGNATVSLDDWGVSVDGQGGSKYSQENRDAAKAMAEGVGQLARTLETALSVDLSGGVKVGVGDRDGIYAERGGQRGEFERDENGQKELVRWVAQRLAEEAGDQLPPAFGAAIRSIDWSDTDAALQDLDFIAQIRAGVEAVSSLKDVDKSLTGLTASAKEAQTAALKPMLEQFEKAKGFGLGAEFASVVAPQVRQMLDGLTNPTTYTATETAIASLTGQVDALREASDTLGLGLSRVIDAAQATALSNLRDSYLSQVEAARYEAQGRGYLNQLATTDANRTTTTRDLTALGVDGAASRAGELVDDQLRAVLRGLDAAQLDDVAATLTGRVADLAREVRAGIDATAAATAAQEAATAAAQAAAAAAADLDSRWRDATADTTAGGRIAVLVAQAQADAAIDAAKAADILRAGVDALVADLPDAELRGLATRFAGVATVSDSLSAALDRVAQSAATAAQEAAAQARAAQDSAATAALLSRTADARRAYADALSREAGTLRDTAARLREVGASLSALRSSLALDSTLSPLSAPARLAEARRQLEAAVADFRSSGNADAGAKAQALMQDYLRASREYNASAPAYQADYDWVIGLTEGLEGLATTTASARETEAAALDRQVAALGGTTSAVLSLADALANYRHALSQRFDGRGDTMTADFRILAAASAQSGTPYLGNFEGGGWRDWTNQVTAARDQNFSSDATLNALQRSLVAATGFRDVFGSGGWAAYIHSDQVTETQREAARVLYRLSGMVPSFASGGDHIGGLRLVGEHGPELEVTGPARIHNATDTARILRAANSSASADLTPLVTAISSMGAAVQSAITSSGADTVRAIGDLTRQVADLSRRLEGQGRELRDLTRIVGRLAA